MKSTSCTRVSYGPEGSTMTTPLFAFIVFEIKNLRFLEKAGLCFVLSCVITALDGMAKYSKQASSDSLPMTRPREPETGDSLTDSAEESQVGAAPGRQESVRVNAE